MHLVYGPEAALAQLLDNSVIGVVPLDLPERHFSAARTGRLLVAKGVALEGLGDALGEACGFMQWSAHVCRCLSGWHTGTEKTRRSTLATFNLVPWIIERRAAVWEYGGRMGRRQQTRASRFHQLKWQCPKCQLSASRWLERFPPSSDEPRPSRRGRPTLTGSNQLRGLAESGHQPHITYKSTEASLKRLR